jgi:four helix bundle protein
LAIAQKEADETLYFLELLYATEYLNEAAYLSIHKETEEVYKIIKSIIISTKQNMKKESNNKST